MNEKVSLSAFSYIVTIAILAIFIVIISCVAVHELWVETALFSVLYLGIIIAALLYAPMRVIANDSGILVRRPIREKFIPYSEITSVRMSPPTMGAIRTCGSGGFFGYWGWFNEGDTGKYFAYYGKASDCFLLTLKDGRKYLIGCDNGREVEIYISKKISH